MSFSIDLSGKTALVTGSTRGIGRAIAQALVQAGAKVAVCGREQAKAEAEQIADPVRKKYEMEGDPYFGTARLWDDGVIDPVDTRRILALALSACLNAPIRRGPMPVFRM